MSDNELDNLFKEAAEGFTPPQDESAWKQMAAMLDKNPVKPAGFWNWKTISTLSGIGVIAITAIWYAATSDQETAARINEKNQETIAKTIEKNESNNATQSVVQEQKEQTQSTGKQDLAPAQSVESKSDGIHVVSKSRTVHETVSKRNSNKIREEQTAEQSQSAINQESAIVSLSAVRNESVGKPETVVPLTESGGSSPVNQPITSAALQESAILTVPDSIKPKSQPVADSVQAASDSTNASKKDQVPEVKGMLSIKAVVSPDFSSINYFSAGKTGINYGLLIGYSFNNRWSVYTGVISSKKLYDTEDVEGSYNWDGHNYPMKKLDGDCRIIDIPINVYYTFFPERSFSLRAGLGFSSYIMRKESYVFCVDNYGYDAYYKQEINGENNEWFKVMNLSVTVSKKLTSRLSAEFEPFVKAPLAGVGEGKVSLVSMGAFINVKYDLVIFK